MPSNRKAIATIYPHKKRGKRAKVRWHWQLKANGNVMADAPKDGYTRRRQARRAWDRFAEYVAGGRIKVVELESGAKTAR